MWSPLTLTSLSIVSCLYVIPQVVAQTTALYDLRFTYPNLPYKVDTNDGPRGIQTGFNICNSTTENQSSRCQTSFVNTIDDFCLWAPPDLSTIGEEEGEAVAWCTKAGHGTRLIPAGALQGVQFIKTPHYIQVTGLINQVQVNIESDDYGGELDPHGADQRGNPLGGLMFSSSFGPDTSVSNGTIYKQTPDWTNFMGANRFCIKVCDPSWEGANRHCEHIYDRIGCAYNVPAAYTNNTFETCLGDDSLPPGVYLGMNNVTSTYTQPPESLGVITSIPYTAAIPASSSCTTFSSAQIYVTITSAPVSTTSSSVASTASAVPTGAPSSGGGASSRSISALPSTTSATSSSEKRSVSSIVAAFVTAFALAMLH